jgi:type II secretory pathway pseudopilin PulG
MRSLLAQKCRGVTIPEILVSSFIIGLLMASIAYVFQTGVTASFKSEGRNDLLNQLKLSVRMLQRDLQQSTKESVSLGTGVPPSSLGCLTHYDLNGAPQLSLEGRPLWQAYFIYYHQTSDNKLYRRRVELIPAAPQMEFPSPIDDYDPGGGTQALSSYLNGGKPIASLLESVSFTEEPVFGDYLDVRFAFLKPRQGAHSESRANFDIRILYRN